MVEGEFKKLAEQGLFDLSRLKKNAMIDCIASAPKIKAKAHSKASIKKAFVHAGFINHLDGTPDVCAVVKASNVNFVAHPGMKDLFFESLEDCVVEMHNEGQISEAFFDDLGFPVDKDSQGTLWPLTSDSLVFSRSQPITNFDTVQRRTQLAVQGLEVERKARIERLDKARNLLEDANRCKDFLQSKCKDGVPLKDLPLETIRLASRAQLDAFIRVRKQKDLSERWQTASKGTVQKVNDGLLCSKTNGPFCLQLFQQLADQPPVIAEDPTSPMPSLPLCVIKRPTVIEFGGDQVDDSFSADRE